MVIEHVKTNANNKFDKTKLLLNENKCELKQNNFRALLSMQVMVLL